MHRNILFHNPTPNTTCHPDMPRPFPYHAYQTTNQQRDPTVWYKNGPFTYRKRRKKQHSFSSCPATRLVQTKYPFRSARSRPFCLNLRKQKRLVKHVPYIQSYAVMASSQSITEREFVDQDVQIKLMQTRYPVTFVCMRISILSSEGFLFFFCLAFFFLFLVYAQSEIPSRPALPTALHRHSPPS
jgi:hypothetical protein